MSKPWAALVGAGAVDGAVSVASLLHSIFAVFRHVGKASRHGKNLSSMLTPSHGSMKGSFFRPCRHLTPGLTSADSPKTPACGILCLDRVLKRGAAHVRSLCLHPCYLAAASRCHLLGRHRLVCLAAPRRTRRQAVRRDVGGFHPVSAGTCIRSGCGRACGETVRGTSSSSSCCWLPSPL